jgi:hypothetical protein
MRRTWLGATVVCTLGAFAVTIVFAPAGSTSPARGLQWLVFVASSVHVASTAWFFTLPEVRAHATRHRRRYLAVPALLVTAAAVVAVVVPPARLGWLLLVFFAWQFLHFQKQNLGMAALSGISVGAGSLSRPERRALMLAGIAGVAGLLLHPELLQLTVDVQLRWAFPAAAGVFGLTVAWGLAAMWRRPVERRPWSFALVYGSSLLFFLPVFVFANPYAAVAGLVVAHGGQYLVLVGLIAGAERADRPRALNLAVLLNVALVGGLALNAASHLHGADPVGRAVYGAYLGAVMAHFVVDAGLWRLRDEFPREFLRTTVPYLLGTHLPGAQPGSAAAAPTGSTGYRPDRDG